MLLENSYERVNEGDPRRHPYGSVQHDPEGKYYNFRSNPELITEALEDFTPWARHQAVQALYDLIT